ncbi:hypothetical protein HW115_10690 [Verrucomicrobiaceae bacterium N1E253]|uniref:Uncharacterized protein n=1 Tax=Oceaniferula marina TaxID=2748318 RepID=A0A851GE88_9BACT|nr:hypothetical protein [Oceaniferula marina]NWK56078.1 hypothetical protein [Oceaniferula marina]
MNVLLKLLYCVLVAWLVCLEPLRAEDVEIQAALVFLVPANAPQARLVEGPAKTGKLPKIHGNFFIQSGGDYRSVSFKQGRRTKSVSYRGGKRCVLYRGAETIAEEEASEENLTKWTEFQLPSSGEYLVVLTPSGKNATTVTPLVLPMHEKVLPKNHIYMMNQSGEELAFRQGKGKPVLLKAATGRSTRLIQPDVAHLRVYRLLPGEGGRARWVEQTSKAYPLVADSKSFCIITQNVRTGRLEMRFLSGY